MTKKLPRPTERQPLVPHYVNWMDLEEFILDADKRGADVVHMVPGPMRQGTSDGPVLIATDWTLYVREPMP